MKKTKKVRADQNRQRPLFERGPKAAPKLRRNQTSPTRAALPKQRGSESSAGSGDSHARLLNYRKHFAKSASNDGYFRATDAIVMAARCWRKLANERVGAIGQTMARWETLYLVAFSDHGLTQGELARLIAIEGPTLVRMLDLLAKKGMIVRRQNATDRRVTTNQITAKGLREIAEIMAITDELREKILWNVDPRCLAGCVEVLNVIIGNIGDLKLDG